MYISETGLMNVCLYDKAVDTLEFTFIRMYVRIQVTIYTLSVYVQVVRQIPIVCAYVCN